jgi:hypothetical protein
MILQRRFYQLSDLFLRVKVEFHEWDVQVSLGIS